MSSETLAPLGRISDHFCFPAVPAAQLKVSACSGNLSGASAIHNTGIAAQQHGVMPAATQQPPMVSLHRSWKTATLLVDNPSGCLVLSWRSWLTLCRLGSRYILDIRMDYGAQHMRWGGPQPFGSSCPLGSSCEKLKPLRFKLIFSMTQVTQSTNPSTMCTNTLKTKNCNYLTTLGLPVFSRNPWLHSVSQHFCSAHTVRWVTRI